jgi:hypothetical protein
MVTEHCTPFIVTLDNIVVAANKLAFVAELTVAVAGKVEPFLVYVIPFRVVDILYLYKIFYFLK